VRLVGVGAGLEQHPDRLDPVVVEGMREGVRATRRRPMLEQESQAPRILGLDRVVQRLTVVRVGPGLEEHAGQLGIVEDSGSAVKRGHLAVLVEERRIRIGAAAKQLTGEAGVGEDRMGDVQERRPAARTAGPIRVALPAATEHEPGPRIALDLGIRGEQRFCALPSPDGRSLDERVGPHRWDCRAQPEAGATGRIRPPPPPA
jgi:hypothetical protein